MWSGFVLIIHKDNRTCQKYLDNESVVVETKCFAGGCQAKYTKNKSTLQTLVSPLLLIIITLLSPISTTTK